MNIEGIDGEGGLPLSETIEIDVSDNEARRAAIGVLEDSLEVAMNRDRRSGQAMEHRDLLRLEMLLNVV